MEGALKSGDLASLKELLDGGRSVNESDIAGATLLHRAVMYGQPAAVKFLLEHGAKVDAKDDKGMTPLHWACQGPIWTGDEAVCTELVDLLIAHGARVNAKDGSGMTPLRLAKEGSIEAVIQLLRRHGARE